MSYPTSDVITWAKGSQALAAIGEYKKKVLTGGNVDSDLYRKIYVERKSLEWQLEQDPTDADGILVDQTNYVYDLCFPYMLEAQYTSGGGGLVIDPVTGGSNDIYPFMIKSSALESDGVSYVNSNILGDRLALFINEYGQQWYEADAFTFVYTATGFTITLPGFDGNANDYHIMIDKLNS